MKPIIDYHDKSGYRQTRVEKLQEAINFLRSINRYCLDRGSNLNFYKPVHGVPLSPKSK